MNGLETDRNLPKYVKINSVKVAATGEPYD